jgi:hypothetical protein
MRTIAPILLVLACGCSPSVTGTPDPGGHGSPDAAIAPGGMDASVAPTSDGGMPMSCDPAALDKMGCPCTDGAQRACYTGPASSRGVGTCHDGMQQCISAGEFSSYGACTGSVVPAAENCKNGLDDNCDGKIDCLDPTCATDPACKSGCTDGDTRPCYDGPQGTEGVGTCHGGTQTCANGMWPNDCPGEQLPTKENCADAKDHDCNHLPGCLDLFSCLLDPGCQNDCQNPDPGCVCPMGGGDTALCPDGTFGKNFGLGGVECCPCTANDCGNAGCCAEQVCQGNQLCAPLNCNTLPPMCKGMVNADCDDFPEDCDEPCCKCTMCN